MKKPNNYENTQASGEFTPVELGGHYLIIKDVTETQSKNGKDMIRVSFDFAANDKQPGYFMVDNNVWEPGAFGVGAEIWKEIMQ